jgi:DNA-binding response OmpR family regulator
MSATATQSILVVDNDSAVLSALTTRLRSKGYACTAAHSGAQALAEFEQHPRDLIITDLKMPDGDGATLAEAVRRISSVPIILISGYKDGFRRRLRNVPDITFLHKPFNADELLRLIAASLSEPGTDRSEAQSGPGTGER